MIRNALDLAYERNTFVGGSSVLSLSQYEVQLWQYYHTFIQRTKIERLEHVGLYGALGSCAGKFKKPIKTEDMVAKPIKQKRSIMDMFNRGRFLKPKKGKK